MTNISFVEVEEWLDSNPECIQDYFIRKADLNLINKWLLSHGFLTVQDYMNDSRGRRRSQSFDSSAPNSPIEKVNDSIFLEKENLRQRTNSKKYLRHDFARSKTKNMFRTCEPITIRSATENRRSSLKGMRKYVSLPPTPVNLLGLLIESKIRLPRYESKDEEDKRELRKNNEKDFFMDIVKDIANDLDLKSLTQKIIINLKILLDADRTSLFLVEESKGKQVLVSKIFDVYAGTNVLPTSISEDNSVQIPWGKGIIGYVAETGNIVNLTNASQNPMYNDEVDRITGYHTNSLLCVPVRTHEDKIIAVAQVVNKNPPVSAFTKEDEKLLETYLHFCGIAIVNAQLFETSRKEYERNRALLEVIHDLFEEQTSLDHVVLKIMQRAQKLLHCERASVLLLSENSETVQFTKVFDLLTPFPNSKINLSSDQCTHLTSRYTLAEHVASSGETLNIPDAYQDSRFDQQIDKSLGFHTRSILCMPIRNRNFQIIGVAEIINRTDGKPFDENDEQLFEAFAIFCGLGINNTILYNEIAKAVAKQSVAIEVLSYHATACGKDIESIKDLRIPEVDECNLRNLSFNDFSLDKDMMILAAIRMFMDTELIERFKIDYETLCKWLLTVRKNYRDVAYHNWRHAFNVAQVMFAILTGCNMKTYLTDVDCLALIVGSLCHDLDHRGTNNAYQEKSGSALAQLYGTQATMEHHHFNHAVMILNGEGHNIFSNLSAEEYTEVMRILKHSIISTDLSHYFKIRPNFFNLTDSGLFDWQNLEHKELLRSMLMTACDVAACTKPWEVQYQVAQLVTSEFFDQGDKEKNELHIQPMALMDRERKDELPILQIDWIDNICLPLYKALAKINPNLKPMVEGAINNRENWRAVKESMRSKVNKFSTEDGANSGSLEGSKSDCEEKDECKIVIHVNGKVLVRESGV